VCVCVCVCVSDIYYNHTDKGETVYTNMWTGKSIAIILYKIFKFSELCQSCNILSSIMRCGNADFMSKSTKFSVPSCLFKHSMNMDVFGLNTS
jgi:hypothetical protein